MRLNAFSPEVASRLAQSDLRIIVTGASGWLGRASLEMLEEALGAQFLERVLAFAATARPMQLRSGTRIDLAMLPSLATLDARPSLVLHFAFLTRDRLREVGNAEFVAQNKEISELLATFMKRSPGSLALVPSSGAVYRANRSIEDDIENNPYGVLKARDEERFTALGAQSSLRIVQPRIFNLAGPFMNKVREYALGSIVSDIVHRKPIAIRANHPVYRSYMHACDLVDLCVAALLSNDPLPEPFDTAGEEVIEVGELATRAMRLLQQPDLPIHRPAIDGEAGVYAGNGAILKELFARYEVPRRPLDRQILDTAEYIKTLSDEEPDACSP